MDTQTKLPFLNEWRPEQFDKMQAALIFYFRRLRYIKKAKPEYASDDWDTLMTQLGLAYTSSSSYAGYWVCGETVYYNEHYRYIGFAIRKDNAICAVCWDKDQHEIIKIIRP